MARISRRELVATGAAAALAPSGAMAGPTLNDASKLDATPVHKAITVRPREVDRLRTELRVAAADGRAVVVGGARHSMGGQSLPRHGLALSFAGTPIEPDTRAGIYRVSSGARWRDVIAALDRHGHSPKVMQANNDFSVGGTFSVNAHGWPAPMGPMGSTVRALRLMLADGQVVEASREREPALFAAAMGGYGLMGVILDLDVEMVRNVILEPRFEVMPAAEFPRRFTGALYGGDPARMAYGRLSVAADGFLQQAALVTFRGATPARAGQAGDGGGSVLSTLTRSVYRAQVGSEAMKQARWYAETTVSPKLQPKSVTRNALLNTPVKLLEERRRDRTDILHEYFLPPERLPAFLTACRQAIPGSGQELLNVTLRYIAADPTSVLAFAPTNRIAAVMSFSQRITPEAERGMRALTEVLVERALALGGTYYLPYRLHARRDQFQRSYPRWAEFAEAKQRYDPKALFRHGLWDRYLAT